MSQKPRFSKPIKKQTLAEQVADAIKESILDGEFEAGEGIPTEPELAQEFNVSRAVIRDATRMLAAQGLVEAQHGRGVFVTESQVAAFGDALLLALRRSEAKVWDVEHFEQIFFPEVVALASAEATDEEIGAIREAEDIYNQTMRAILTQNWGVDILPPAENQRFRESYQALLEMIFAATHNKVFQLLAKPLQKLRNLRSWQDDEASLEETLQMEQRYFKKIIDAIASRDPILARKTVSQLMQLPPEAETVMRQTPVGEVPVIPVDWRI